MKVLVINHCSTNKGDKAVLEFVLNELAANGIRHITVSANEPTCCHATTTEDRGEVRYVPWGWNGARNRSNGLIARLRNRLMREFYPRSYSIVRRNLLRGTKPTFLARLCNRKFWRALQSADIVVSTGGHHVTSILAPQAISPQTFEMGMALLAGKPLLLWSQSIGPFEFTDDENRLFIREILSQSTGIYIRDKRSFAEIERLGISNAKTKVTFESVLGFGGHLDNLNKPSEREPIVGIAVYSAQARTDQEQAAYVGALREIVDHVTYAGYRIQFFPMQLEGEVADDRPCIEAVLQTVRDRNLCSVYKDAPTMLEHIGDVGKCRFFIGHKTHSVIIALVTGTPLLAIAYHPKTYDFMDQFGLTEHCLDDDLLTGPRLIEMFDRLQMRADAVGEHQLAQSKLMGEIVRNDFRMMLGSLPPLEAK